MKPIKISRWNNQMLDHEINLIERRAERWARIFNSNIVDYLPSKYASLVLERFFRNAVPTLR